MSNTQDYANLSRPKLNAIENAISRAMKNLRALEMQADKSGQSQLAMELMLQRHALSDDLFEVQRAREAARISTREFHDVLDDLDNAVSEAKEAEKNMRKVANALQMGAKLLKLLGSLVKIVCQHLVLGRH